MGASSFFSHRANLFLLYRGGLYCLFTQEINLHSCWNDYSKRGTPNNQVFLGLPVKIKCTGIKI